MKKIMKKIELKQEPRFFSHNEYLEWTINFETLSKKDKQKVRGFLMKTMSLCPKEWIVDFLRIFIDGKQISLPALLEYDLNLALRYIETGQISIEITDNVVSLTESSMNRQHSSNTTVQAAPSSLKNYIEILSKLASMHPDTPTIYYHNVPIDESVLFTRETAEDGTPYRRIRSELLPYMRFLNLSDITWDGVLIEDTDLSWTNIRNLKLDRVYKRSAKNTNLSGILLSSETISDVDLSHAILKETFASIDASTTSLENATLDDTVILIDSKGTILPHSKEKALLQPIIHL